MKPYLIEIKWRLVGILGKFLLDMIFSFAKIESSGYEKVARHMEPRKFIAAIWHSRILAFSYLYKGWDAAILVSQSDDGEIIARILRTQGFDPVRGSTTRSGLRALAALIKKVKTGKPAVIIPDGPQGPRFIVQPGIITLGKKTGLPVLPMTYSAKRAKIFPSWDRFMLPAPFTRCQVIYGSPIHVPPDADKETEERCRLELENELMRITTEADSLFGRRIT